MAGIGVWERGEGGVLVELRASSTSTPLGIYERP